MAEREEQHPDDEEREEEPDQDPQTIPAERTAEGLGEVEIGGEGQDDPPGRGARRG